MEKNNIIKNEELLEITSIMLKGFDSINQRITDESRKTDERFNKLESRMEEKFEETDQKINKLESRIETESKNNNDRFTNIEKSLKEINETMQEESRANNQRFESIEKKIEGLIELRRIDSNNIANILKEQVRLSQNVERKLSFMEQEVQEIKTKEFTVTLGEEQDVRYQYENDKKK